MIRIGVAILAERRVRNTLKARHIRQIQVEQNDVIVVDLAKVDPVFAEISGVYIDAFCLEHQLDTLCRSAIIFN